MPKLIISPEDPAPISHDLEESDNAIVTIGRASDNIIQIDDASVSSHHAQLASDNGKWILKDLNSTNGTSYNGNPLAKEVSLLNGDEIEFGKVATKFETGEAIEHQPLPEAGSVSAELSEESRKPSNFENASPFKQKLTKKDPLGQAVMAVAAISVLAFVAVVVQLLLLKPSP